MPATQTTRIGRKWLLKMTFFLVLCLGTAIWFGKDAAIGYPKRGRRAAERLEFLYLDAVTQRGTHAAIVSFDPVAEYRRLDAARRAGTLSDEERTKYEWLSQLKIVGALQRQPGIPDAVARYRELAPKWLAEGGKTPPAAPLNSYDILVQWAIAAAALVLAVWLIVHVARVALRRYSWDPQEKRLYLPDGSTLVPADVAEFDKRKWDKFLIYLKIQPSHERHGGKELLLDLYHHDPLEDWVLEMERIAFPDSTPPPSHGGTQAQNPEVADG